MMPLYDSELKVLELLWEHGAMRASEIYKILEEKVGWNRNTSYTVIKRCIEKGLITRTEPHFVCTANITKKEAQKDGLSELLSRLFSNSKIELMKAFVTKNNLSEQDIEELQDLVKKLK